MHRPGRRGREARDASDTVPVEPHRASPSGLAEVFTTFLKLGCLSFGGPISHLGYLRAELVSAGGCTGAK